MKSSRILAASAAAVFVFALAACGGDDDSSDAASTPSETASTVVAEQDIVALASATPDLSTLVTAVTAADLATTLQGTGPFTVFAPTDEAFSKLPASVTQALLLPCNKDALTQVLTYHVVSGEVKSTDIEPGAVATVEGSDVTLAVDGDTVKVNDATVIGADVDASNGVVHLIDTVLVPSTVDPATLKATC